MNIVIEKNVPMPAAYRGGWSATMRILEVGDSFLVPVRNRAAVMSMVSRFAPKRFISRAVSEDEVRVWRTA